MKSQLAESSSIRTMVLSTHELAGARGHQIGCSSVRTSVVQSDCSRVLRQQYSSSLHPQAGKDSFHFSVQQDSGTFSSSGPICDPSHSNPCSRSQKCNSRCTVLHKQSQPYSMADSSGNLKQSVLCLRDPPSGHVCHGGEQGDSSPCFSLPGRQRVGGRRPLIILGRLRTIVRLPSSPQSPQNPPEDQGLSGHHGDSHGIPTPVSTVAPVTTTTQSTSSHSPDRRSNVPIHPKHSTPSVPQRPSTIGRS